MNTDAPLLSNNLRRNLIFTIGSIIEAESTFIIKRVYIYFTRAGRDRDNFRRPQDARNTSAEKQACLNGAKLRSRHETVKRVSPWTIRFVEVSWCITARYLVDDRRKNLFSARLLYPIFCIISLRDNKLIIKRNQQN